MVGNTEPVLRGWCSRLRVPCNLFKSLQFPANSHHHTPTPPKCRRQLFAALDRCEDILAKQRYLVGNTLTEADIRLFMTLIRFDEVRGGCWWAVD